MTSIEKQIAHEIAKANDLTLQKLGLRFDKVVVRLFENLRASIEGAIPHGETVVVTVTAPIKLPAKTAYELEGRIKDLLESRNRYLSRRVSVFQNEVSFKIVKSSTKQAVKFVGVAHNRGTDSKLLLDLVTNWITES